VNFARVPNPEQTVGKRASTTLYPELFKAHEAKVNTVSLEGVPLLTAFTRSPFTGWTVAAGLSARSIEVPLWRNLAITAGIGSILLTIGLIFAVGMATRIARAETLHGLLVNELNHRIKNTLATVQSIAMQTFGSNADLAEARHKFEGRLVSLGRAHSLLSDEKWESADMRSIAQNVLEPFAGEPGRVRLSGPDVRMPPSQALMFSMILHELATNAAKYGALSSPAGRLHVDWYRDPKGSLTLTWRESGGPPVQEPARKGFGSRLINDGLAGQGGRAELAFNESGLVCTIHCPVAWP
jgi:two-component sensor histidine kinase